MFIPAAGVDPIAATELALNGTLLKGLRVAARPSDVR